MSDKPKTESEKAKEVFEMMEKGKTPMSKEEKKVFSLRLNLLALFLIVLIIIVLFYLLKGYFVQS